MKKAAVVLFAIIILNLSTSSIALAWNPATSDLTGTSTSTDNSVADALARFDIDHTTAGIQTGEDTDSIAFAVILAATPADYISRPTALIDTGVTLTSPELSYDTDTGTFASFEYDQAGTVQSNTFSSSTGTINSVNLYIHVAVAASIDDTYALAWSVGGTAGQTLWAASTTARALSTYSWLNLVEPIDGSWSWTDVANFELTWDCVKVPGPDNAVVSLYEVWLVVKGSGFDATAMTTDDQYEIDFTIGEEDFSMLFIATGMSAGTMKLFYRATGGGAWSNGDTHSEGPIVSGTAYQSVSANIGFTLTSSSATVGSVKFVVKKTYLASFGATSNTVTGIFTANFASGTGEAGSGGATPNDRSPSTGGASWTLSEAIPDFPHGTLLLVGPVISVYVVLRKRNGTDDPKRPT
jgi:hypothetical protein